MTCGLARLNRANYTTTALSVVGQFAVAALSERRTSLRIQDRRSETAATRVKLTHNRPFTPIACPTPFAYNEFSP
jgi:hypothetical protein